MKKKMLTIVLLGFFSFWMLPADSRLIPLRFNPSHPQIVALTIAEDAVDDMYDGCAKTMNDTVYKTYLDKEKKEFRYAWDNKEVDDCVSNGLDYLNRQDRQGRRAGIDWSHIEAICVYTADTNSNNGKSKFYAEFNAAVRVNRKKYTTTSFKFHSLHFLLTRAIQILKNSQAQCHNTYRRTRDAFTGKQNQTIRFGQFTSSSKSIDIDPTFGKQTCFKIKTCYGADLKKYSPFHKTEKEVLIPPYEVFKIRSIKKKGRPIMKDCLAEIVLDSVGYFSNLNCNAVGGRAIT